jgi:hypothetical protein
VDEKFLQPGDRVVLMGNLDCLGGWDRIIELNPDPFHPDVWSIAVEMPFCLADSSLTGIFHYKYFIESARDGRVAEGQYERTETKMRRNLFHAFRPNYNISRFRGATFPSTAVTIEKFVSFCIGRLKRREITTQQMMTSFDEIMDCLPGGYRAMIEAIFNDFLAEPVLRFVIFISFHGL